MRTNRKVRRNVRGLKHGGRVQIDCLFGDNFVLRLLSFLIALTLALTGCVFDVGVSPAAGTDFDSQASDGAANNDGMSRGTGDGWSVSVGPAGLPSNSRVWPVTFTNSLSAGGLTLTPLGARAGVSGVLRAPDKSLRLEALP